MYIFIKDRKTFKTKTHQLALDFEITRSVYNVYSSFVVSTPETMPKNGDILYADDGFWGVIENIAVDEKKTTLEVSQIITLFSRKLLYAAESWSSLEQHLADLISANFVNCPDAFYALPYLQVTALSQTASAMKPDVENETYTIQSYASKARRLKNIFFDWGLTRTALVLDIVKKAPSVKNIDFSNPNYTLTEQDFSIKTVAKITAKAVDTGTVSDWYLDANGNITTNPPTNRIDGEWETIIVQYAEDVSDAVADEFSKNVYSHNIKFLAPKRKGFALYDDLNIVLNGAKFKSYVSGVTERKGSDFVEVSCGELQMSYPFKNLL